MDFARQMRLIETHLGKFRQFSATEIEDRLHAMGIVWSGARPTAELDKAEFEVRRAKMQVDQSQEALAALTITAPEPGLVVYKTYRQGKIKVGDQTWPGGEIIELPDLSSMQVRTRVNEIVVHQVAEGQEVIIKVDALADQVFRGTVSRIATLARTEGEARIKVFDVDVLIDGEGGALRPGMTAQCRIVTARIADAVSVPLEAVFERDGQSVVLVVDGGLEPRPVTLGPRNDDFVVIADGLDAGEVVSLRDPQRPRSEAQAADRAAAEEARP